MGIGRWWLTYVDDLLAVFLRSQLWLHSAVALLLLQAVGFPFSWKKLLIGLQMVWTGHAVDAQLCTIAPSEDKRMQVTAFLSEVLEGKTIAASRIQRGVARARWVAQDVPFMACFLQPLHSWASATTRAGTPGLIHKIVARFCIGLLKVTPAPTARFFSPFPGECAADAKATPTEAVIGGWASLGPHPTKLECWWFSIKLSRDRFPWVWAKGTPQRIIAALEMLATVFLVRLVGKLTAHSHVTLRLPGLTDNQGNAVILMKEYARRLPVAAVHMELAANCLALGLFPEISHVSRDDNQWADELTNIELDNWMPNRRWAPDVHAGFFWLLDDLLGASTCYLVDAAGAPGSVTKRSKGCVGHAG